MADDALVQADAWLGAMLGKLSPAARRTLLRDIGRQVRKNNQNRITEQVGPDGTPWPARRKAHGKIRSTAKMMTGLRAARRMALNVSDGEVTIGYSDTLARIAAVHQYGEVDAVEPGGPKVKYPVRPLLGLSVEDVAYVRRAVLEAIKPD